jgi:excisionase family DNA binding protein
VRSLREWAEYLEKQERKVKAAKDGEPGPAASEAKTPGPLPKRGSVTPRAAEESITQPRPGVLPGGRVIPPALRRGGRAEVPEFSDFVSDQAGPAAEAAGVSPVAQKVAARKPTDLEPWVVVPAESPAAESDEERPAAEAVPREPAAAAIAADRRQPDLFAEEKRAKRTARPARAKPSKQQPAARPPRARKKGQAKGESAPTAVAANGPTQIPAHLSALVAYEGTEAAQPYYKKAREHGGFTESRLELLQRLIDPPLTLEETARLLNVCPTTVRRYTNKGLLNHHRTPGNQRRFRLSDVIGFMAEQGRLPDQPGTDA